MKETDYKEAFAKRLKELMEEKGVSQADIQRGTLITNQAVSLWLAGKREPLLGNLWKLADYFGCSLDYLSGKTDEWRP